MKAQWLGFIFKRSKQLVILLAFSTSCHAASIIADFTDGNSVGDATDTWDQYPGLVGGGWLTRWTVLKSSTWAPTLSVVNNANSVNSGGNYLSVYGGSTSTSGTAYFGLYRQHDTSVVDLSQPLTYTFDYRIDYAPTAANQYYICSSTAATTDNSSATWYIGNSGTGPYWLFYDGTKSGSASATSSTVLIVQDHVYHFVVNVDPSTQSWTASVVDVTASGTPYTTGTLGFRTNVTSDGSYLQFLIWDNKSLASDTFGFSVDNLTIASIPEPSVVCLMMTVLIMGASLYAKRRIALCNSKLF